MLMRHVALEAVAFAVAVLTFSAVLHAGEPARRWRPATTADVPAGTVIRPATSAGSGAPTDNAAQRVHINPATGAIVPAPSDARADAAANADIDAGAPQLMLQKSPSGILYVDTTGYQHTATATLDAQGSVGLDCEDPPQDATTVAHLAGNATPAPHGAHASRAPVLTETAPASSDPGDAALQSTPVAAAKADAQQRRLAAVVADFGAATVASPATERNDASRPADRPASAPAAASLTTPPDKPELRRAAAALPQMTEIPAAASASTSAEQ